MAFYCATMRSPSPVERSARPLARSPQDLIYGYDLMEKTFSQMEASLGHPNEPLKIPWLIDCYRGLYYLVYWGL